MSGWFIQYTRKADSDLATIYEYIAFELQEPAIAKEQVSRIMDAVDSLVQMPFRYRYLSSLLSESCMVAGTLNSN